jgi:hypothetical protein
VLIINTEFDSVSYMSFILKVCVPIFFSRGMRYSWKCEDHWLRLYQEFLKTIMKNSVLFNTYYATFDRMTEFTLLNLYNTPMKHIMLFLLPKWRSIDLKKLKYLALDHKPNKFKSIVKLYALFLAPLNNYQLWS